MVAKGDTEQGVEENKNMKRSLLNESDVFNKGVLAPPLRVSFGGNTVTVEECVRRITGAVPTGTAPVDHVCSGVVCHPRTTAAVSVYNVYVCDYGAVHVCGEDYCTLASPTPQGEYVCPISGLVLGVEHNVSYQKEGEDASYRIVHNTAAAKKHKPSTDEKFHTKALAIIMKLFYSDTRKELNRKAETARTERCKGAVERYTQQQQRKAQFINLQEVLRIKSNVLSEPLPYRILREDQDTDWITNKCLHTMKQIWQKLNANFYGGAGAGAASKLYEQVKEAPVRLNAVYTALALVYTMKTGHRVNEKVFVPYDPFVAENVPREKDITMFGYQVARMKKSKDLLISFFEKSVELNMYIRVDIAPAAAAPPPPREQLFKPTALGYYCKQCERRYYEGNKCQHIS